MADSTLELYSTAAPGIESVVLSELVRLGVAGARVSHGGVAWRGSLRDLYRANLWLRTASRVLVRVSRFHVASFAELEKRGAEVPWGRYVRARDSVRFRVTCHKSALYHSEAVAERLARCVAAATGCVTASDWGGAGAVDNDDDHDGVGGEQLFIVRLERDRLTLSADSSGSLLHRRGYRQAVAKAPMRETLAAAMLLSSGWDPTQPLLDPLCGSGTIPIEAALIARRVAPGIQREFRFQRWPGFDAASWAELRRSAVAGSLGAAPSVIIASDRDAGAVAASRSNAERAGVAASLSIEQRPVSASDLSGIAPHGWLITNPPYGVRIGTDVRDLYAALGALVRGADRWRLGILIASPALGRQLGIDLEQVFESRNGGIPIRFMTTAGR
jgi:putative N6-adenine-specific DNA methylase